MAGFNALVLFTGAVLATLCAAQRSGSSGGGNTGGTCCDQRTYQVTAAAFEPVTIDQSTVFVAVHIETGLNQSTEAYQRAADAVAGVQQVLARTDFVNITNRQEVGISVTVRNNFSCVFGVCSNIPIGFQSDDTISFNAPLSIVNNITLAILNINGTSIRNQQGFVPPEIFGAAQNTAIKRALTYAQYRADQTYSDLDSLAPSWSRQMTI
jgi:hypothetical protein